MWLRRGGNCSSLPILIVIAVSLYTFRPGDSAVAAHDGMTADGWMTVNNELQCSQSDIQLQTAFSTSLFVTDHVSHSYRTCYSVTGIWNTDKARCVQMMEVRC